MRRIQEIEIELPQIVLERADAAYAQIRQQASQEKQLTGKRFPRAAGILLAVVILLSQQYRHRRRNHGIPPLSGRAA